MFYGQTGYGILRGSAGLCPGTAGIWYTEVEADLAAFGLNGGDI